MRWGWFDLLSLRDADVPERILEEFRAALADRLKVDPYRPPSVLAKAA